MEKILELLYVIIKLITKQSKTNRWLTPESLEEEYDLKEATMSKYRMDGRIPFYKIGSKFIRYNRNEIDEWIEQHKIIGKKNG